MNFLAKNLLFILAGGFLAEEFGGVLNWSWLVSYTVFVLAVAAHDWALTAR